MEELITTIIPTFRRPRQLQRAIQSVLDQSFRDLTVIVYDNDSGDETESVIKKIMEQDPRVQYFRHPKNIGAYENFQFGMERVKTPFFSLLSDDDLLLPEFYEKTLEMLKKFPMAAFCAGKGIIKNEHEQMLGETLQGWKRWGYFVPPEGLADILRNTILWTATLFRTEPVHALGGFDAEIGFARDHEFLVRLGKSVPFCVIDTPCAVFYEHHGSFSNRTPALEKLESLQKFFEKHRELFESSPKAYGNHLRSMGRYAIAGGDYWTAWRLLFGSVSVMFRSERERRCRSEKPFSARDKDLHAIL